jgi:hypothetical protein
MDISHASGRTTLVRAAILLALILGVLFISLSARAHAAQFQTCATLKGKHLVSDSRAMVVMQLINKERTEGMIERVAYVCASSKGRAWRVGSVSEGGGEAPGIKVVTGAGEWVALRYEWVNGEAFSESESAVNATNGKHFQYWSFGGGMGTYVGGSLEAVKLDSQGRLALITGVEGKPMVEGEFGPTVVRKVIGVEPGGKRMVLDSALTASIPTSSLELIGGFVHWTDGGLARSAQP